MHSSGSDIFVALHGSCSHRSVVIIEFFSKAVLVPLFLKTGSSWNRNDLGFSTENHTETLSPYWFVDTWNTSSTAPFIQLTAKSVRFKFQQSEFAGSQKSVAAGSVDMCNRRVYDCRFRWAAKLRKIWKECGKVEEPSVQSLPPGSFDGIMSSSALGSACSTRSFTFSSNFADVVARI
jgi:hypothetical protein